MDFSPYDFIDPRPFRRLMKRVDIVHREKCPSCGRTLVNLYRHKDKWLCKRCMDNKEAELWNNFS